MTTTLVANCRYHLGDFLEHSRLGSGALNGNFVADAAPLPKSDINGDGYADLVIGASENGDPSLSGIAYIIYGKATGLIAPSLNNCTYPDCTEMENPADEPSAAMGSAFAIAGDVNGDGFADAIVGAPNNGIAGAVPGLVAGRGALYIFYGSASGIAAHPQDVGASSYTCSGPASGCTIIQNPENLAGSFASAVTAVRDLNRDGFDDILVGAHSNSANSGKAYIFYGSAMGPDNRPFTGSADTCAYPICTTIANPTSASDFGVAVSSAGDIDGDGNTDITVGSPGVVHIFYSDTNGPVARTTPVYSCSGLSDGCTEIANPDSTVTFGQTVSYGDFNHDGLSDIAVGASTNNGDAGILKGAAYVFLSSAVGAPYHPLPVAGYTCSGTCIEIRNPANTMNGQFGYSVAGVGDVNRDGYADLLVGAISNDPDNTADERGIAYLFYGGSPGIVGHAYGGAGAYNCTGFPDCTEIRNPRTDAFGQYGWYVSAAHDVNGDGFMDLWVNAIQDGPGQAGMVFAYYGGTSGITSHLGSGGGHVCSGPPDCTSILNPRATVGKFGSGR